MRRYPRQAIKDWPENERPRERLIRYGTAGLSEAQLLSIILGSGSAAHGKSAVDISRNLMESFGSLRELETASVAELCSVDGMGKTKASQVKAALDLGKRMVSEDHAPYGKPFSTSEDVFNFFAPFMGNLKKEIFKIILLDNQNFMMRDVTVSEGSLTQSIVHPREVFKPAIRESAASIILVHNHPSGNPKPSREDKSITSKLVSTGEVVGISVLDHIIIGKKTHFSFCDERLL